MNARASTHRTSLKALGCLSKGYTMVRKCVALSLLVATVLVGSLGFAKGIEVNERIAVSKGIEVNK